MYAFVSGKYDGSSKESLKSLTAVNFLRISEVDYYDFLRRWVNWLRESGIARASEAASESTWLAPSMATIDAG